MSIANTIIGLPLLIFCIIPFLHASFPNIHSDPASSLLATLRNFSKIRHHDTNPAEKQKANELIFQQFQNAGMETWREEVILDGVYRGENIVGIFRGRKTGTHEDKIVVVGAHYDTREDTTGVDDNGSGVAALLELAKQIGAANLTTRNTILLVAFDFEENRVENGTILSGGLVGSEAFVKNFTNYLLETRSSLGGAIILESLVNYNSSAGSQRLPVGTSVAVPSAYQAIKNDLFRGNFLAVVGRANADQKLLSLMDKYYEKDSEYRAELVPIPLTGKPSDSPQFADFYRSDHYSFWQNNVNYSALMLTDTAEFRGYMEYCYHKLCDDITQVDEKDLEFLRRTINAIIQVTLDLSEADENGEATTPPPSNTTQPPTLVTTTDGISRNTINTFLPLFLTLLSFNILM